MELADISTEKIVWFCQIFAEQRIRENCIIVLPVSNSCTSVVCRLLVLNNMLPCVLIEMHSNIITKYFKILIATNHNLLYLYFIS